MSDFSEQSNEMAASADKPKPSIALDHRRRRVIVGVVLTGILVSLFLYATVRRQEHRLIEEDFKHRATDRMKSIASQFDTGIMQVVLLAAYMQTTPDWRETQFRAIANSLFSEHALMQALSWSPRVSADELASYVAGGGTSLSGRELREFRPDGTLSVIDVQSRVHSDPQDLFIVELIEPLDSNRSAVGLDITSEAVRRSAVHGACERGRPTASGRLRLVQESGSQFGTLVVIPVYRDADVQASDLADRSHVAGVVVGVYRIAEAVEAALENLEPAGIDVHLFDMSASAEEQLLYTHASRVRKEPIDATGDPDVLRNRFCESSSFAFGGRQWELFCTPTADFFDNRSTWLPLIVLCGGLLGTFLLAVYIGRLGKLHSQLQREAVVRVEAERRIAEQERSLAHISRLSTMGEMVAGIAHEINQPLSAVSNFSTAARIALSNCNHDCKSPIEDWLHQISAQSVRCGDIIRRLRRFVTKEPQDFQLVDLNEVVRDSVGLISSDKLHSVCRIDCRLPDRGLQVHASEVQLQQVMVNLLRNACDSTREKTTPEIRVSVERIDDRVRLTVQDNGTGIEEEQRANVFDPFFTTRPEGMGMGLAISRSIIEAHHGKLWLASGTGAGATFHIELPVTNAA